LRSKDHLHNHNIMQNFFCCRWDGGLVWGAHTPLWLHEREESSVRYLMGNGDRSDVACVAFAYTIWVLLADFTKLSVCIVEGSASRDPHEQPKISCYLRQHVFVPSLSKVKHLSFPRNRCHRRKCSANQEKRHSASSAPMITADSLQQSQKSKICLVLVPQFKVFQPKYVDFPAWTSGR